MTSKPQYVLHPGRALRRARRLVSKPPALGEPRIARLPWGLGLKVYESDAIGYSILVGRVFDPCVTETIHRLVDPGDLAVDIGANVGYLTSLAAVRAGRSGRVIAVEPHPAVFDVLRANVDSWANYDSLAEIEPLRVALSSRAGQGTIVAGSLFEQNMGLAKLAEGGVGNGQHSDEVELRRLDDLVSPTAVGLLKLDVEGHEAEVLRGASGLLERALVRDIVFEDHQPYPSEATTVVERAGYQLVSLSNDLGGLRLKAPEDRGAVRTWPGPSYLATSDPARSVSRLEGRGWHVKGIGFPRPQLRRNA